jgi:hypothetical protein
MAHSRAVRVIDVGGHPSPVITSAPVPNHSHLCWSHRNVSPDSDQVRTSVKGKGCPAMWADSWEQERPGPHRVGVVLLVPLTLAVLALDILLGIGIASAAAQSGGWVSAPVAAVCGVAGPAASLYGWRMAAQKGRPRFERLFLAEKLGLAVAIVPTLLLIAAVYVIAQAAVI